MRAYGVTLADAVHKDPAAYASFNAFFVRQLDPAARPTDASADGIASPCDGTISRIDAIRDGMALQAKGSRYSVQDLVADAALAERLAGGTALTIYLSPRDYHRVHAPVTARFAGQRNTGEARFGVSPQTVSRVNSLYVTNERTVMQFEVDTQPLVVVMVGAVGVGHITTPWDRGALADAPDRIAKGDEIGRFNLGSTVIVLAPRDLLRWREDLVAGVTLRVGERIGERLTGG